MRRGNGRGYWGRYRERIGSPQGETPNNGGRKPVENPDSYPDTGGRKPTKTRTTADENRRKITPPYPLLRRSLRSLAPPHGFECRSDGYTQSERDFPCT